MAHCSSASSVAARRRFGYQRDPPIFLNDAHRAVEQQRKCGLPGYPLRGVRRPGLDVLAKSGA